jgi:hypothetical protein
MEDPGYNQGLISLYTLVIRKLDASKVPIITMAFLRTYSFSGGGGGSVRAGETASVV